jgi:hypothetical protein
LERVRLKGDYYAFWSNGVEIKNGVIAQSTTQIVDNGTGLDVGRAIFLQNVLIMIESLGLFNPAREMAIML